VGDEKTSIKEKDMEEEVSLRPPVNIRINLFNVFKFEYLIKGLLIIRRVLFKDHKWVS
jgi:hypothetical protein